MSEQHGVLTLRLGAASQSVSALSSLLRTLQAAAREAAQQTAEGAAAFASGPPPVMTVRLRPGAEASGPELMFAFSTGDDGSVVHSVSDAAFGALLDALGELLKSSPILTLWGRGAATGRRRVDRARRSERTGPLGERMEQLRAELERLGEVELRYGDRRIRLSSGGVEIAP